MKTKFKSILRLARAQLKLHPDYTDNTDTDAIQKLRVADHVHEQDMSHLKMKMWILFGDPQSILTPLLLQSG
jgi:hypothetical protein